MSAEERWRARWPDRDCSPEPVRGKLPLIVACRRAGLYGPNEYGVVCAPRWALKFRRFVPGGEVLYAERVTLVERLLRLAAESDGAYQMILAAEQAGGRGAVLAYLDSMEGSAP